MLSIMNNYGLDIMWLASNDICFSWSWKE